MNNSRPDDWKAMGFKSEAEYGNWLRQSAMSMQYAQDKERANDNASHARGPLANSPDPEFAQNRKDRRLPLSPMKNMYDTRIRDITHAPATAKKR